MRLENNKKYIGKSCEVLVENKMMKQNKYFGRTKFQNAVIFTSDDCKPGDLLNINIISSNRNNLFGEHKINKVRAA